MPLAEDGGYFTYCDPGTIEVYTLDFGKQIPVGDTVLTSGMNAPTLTIIADSGVDPNAQACVLAPALVMGPITVPGQPLPSWNISFECGGLAPAGFQGGVTYKFTYGVSTAGGLFLTNYAFLQCRSPS